jgi:hypothetical protein
MMPSRAPGGEEERGEKEKGRQKWIEGDKSGLKACRRKKGMHHSRSFGQLNGLLVSSESLTPPLVFDTLRHDMTWLQRGEDNRGRDDIDGEEIETRVM